MSKKNIQKYAASTMAAAAAVAGVAPIAISADTTDFSDVNENHDFYKEIMDLSEDGIITGFIDEGLFKPEDAIFRAQAMNMMVRSLDLKAPEDIDGTLENLVDVDADSEYAGNIAAVVEEGIFTGNEQTNKINPWEHINREQMASVLVRAFDLDEYDADEVDINLKGVSDTHKDNVQILANLGITRGEALNNFKPSDDISRGQFAAQVHRTLEYVNSEEGEIVVDTISAVSTNIKNEADQQLPIKINNGRTVTVEELEEAGYSVEFNYNKRDESIYNKETGVVDGSTASSAFKYQVVVTPEEGEAIKSDWVDVNVLNAETPVEVTEIGLSNDLPYLTLGEDEVRVDVLKAVNAFDEELETNLPEIDSIESSDPRVAYADGTTIKPRKEGSVDLKVNFKESSNLDPVELTVEVRAEQVATSIEAEDIKVEVDNELEPSYKVVDQYGEKMRSETETNKVVTDETGEEVEAPEAFGTEGTYTVTVYKGNDTEEELGSFTVTTVDIAGKKVDEFELTTDEEFELDINPDISKVQDTIKVEGYVEGVKVSDLESKLENVEIRTSDADIVTIVENEEENEEGTETAEAPAKAENTLRGMSTGTAEISLVLVEGDMETVLTTHEVTVENTVKLIKSVDFKDNVEVVTIDDQSPTQLKQAVVDATDLETKHIEKVEYAPADNSVIVTIEEVYGGEEFLLPAELKADDSTASVVDHDLTLAFSESIDANLSAELIEGTTADSSEDGQSTFSLNSVVELENTDTLNV